MFKIRNMFNMILAVGIIFFFIPSALSANPTPSVSEITEQQVTPEKKTRKKVNKTPKTLFISRGYASTYGNDPVTGHTDPYDNNIPALPGASNDNPGLAFLSRSTLGGYWRITAPNGKTAVVRQTDYGPAKWTGKTFDINAVAVRKHFKYRQGNHFPTKKGTWKGEYLGKKYN